MYNIYIIKYTLYTRLIKYAIKILKKTYDITSTQKNIGICLCKYL